jgi:hypothetical protein
MKLIISSGNPKTLIFLISPILPQKRTHAEGYEQTMNLERMGERGWEGGKTRLEER